MLPKKVLVFGDIGIDDTIALIYSYFNDAVDVVGVVANYGNIPREKALANVHYVKEQLNISETINIMSGAEIPMTGENPEFFADIHGEYGLGPIHPPAVSNDVIVENFYNVIDIIKKYKDELIIVNIGRLTSLATLFICYQSLMKHVKAFYIMGGAFWVPGNVTAVSEANFYGDPMAVHTVLKFARNITIIPLNVTRQAIATPQMVDYINQTGKTKLVKSLLDYYYDFYKKRDPSILGSPLHDVVTIMAAIHEDMFTFVDFPVMIVQRTSGTERGQSIADIRSYAEEDNGYRHRIAFDINYKSFYSDFMTVMTGQRFE